MKRIQDKIKDLVEPQTFEQVGDYAEDPAQALAAYRFTDVTSDLLSRWLHVLANLPAGRGGAPPPPGGRGGGERTPPPRFCAAPGAGGLWRGAGGGHPAAGAGEVGGGGGS